MILILLGTLLLMVFYFLSPEPGPERGDLALDSPPSKNNQDSDSTNQSQNQDSRPPDGFLPEAIPDDIDLSVEPSSSGYLPENYRMKSDSSLISESRFLREKVNVKWDESCQDLEKGDKFEDLEAETRKAGFDGSKPFPTDIAVENWNGFYELNGNFFQVSFFLQPETSPKRYRIHLFRAADAIFETQAKEVSGTLGKITSRYVGRVEAENFIKKHLKKVQDQGGKLGSRTVSQTIGRDQESRMTIFWNGRPIRYYNKRVRCQYEGVENTICRCVPKSG